VTESNQPARSISGNSVSLPEPRGHSRANVLLRTLAASKSLSIAHATIRLPLGCLTSPSSRIRPAGGSLPVSSRNSRRAAAYGSSPSSYSPLTIDHPPSSLLAQNGDRKSTRLNSSHRTISYAVFCLKKKKIQIL